MMDIFQQIHSGNWENVRQMIAESPDVVHRLDVAGNNILQTAIVSDADLQLINLLLRRGVEVNQVNTTGNSPFYFAVWKRTDPGIIESLLAKGAYVNESFHKQREILELCAQYNPKVDILKLLIHAGGIPKPDKTRQTLLHRAALLGNTCIEI